MSESIHSHTWTFIPEGKCCWQAFAGACEGGGTPPEWTKNSDPSTATPPTDAAGRLWRIGDSNEGRIPGYIYSVAHDFSTQFLDDFHVTPIAAYYSSGGQEVYLLACGLARYVLIRRPEKEPRIGSREASMCRRIGLDADQHVCIFGN